MAPALRLRPKMPPLAQFIVFAVLCALGLWVLSQFPTLDATVAVVSSPHLALRSLSIPNGCCGCRGRS